MIAGFRPREVVKLTGVPYSTLNLWAKKNFISPTLCKGNGTGHERIYSQEDVDELMIAHSLKRSGLPLGIIKQAIGKFRMLPNVKSVELILSFEPRVELLIHAACTGNVNCANCKRLIACDGRHNEPQYCSETCEVKA